MNTVHAFLVAASVVVAWMSGGWLLGTLPGFLQQRVKPELAEELAFRLAPALVQALAALGLIAFAAQPSRGEPYTGGMLALTVVVAIVGAAAAHFARCIGDVREFVREYRRPDFVGGGRHRYIDRTDQWQSLGIVVGVALALLLIATYFTTRGLRAEPAVAAARACLLATPIVAICTWVDQARWFTSLHRRSEVEAHFLSEDRYERGLTMAALLWGLPYLFVVSAGSALAWLGIESHGSLPDRGAALGVAATVFGVGLGLSLLTTWGLHERANRRARRSQRDHDPVSVVVEKLRELASGGLRAEVSSIEQGLEHFYFRAADPFDERWLEFPRHKRTAGLVRAALGRKEAPAGYAPGDVDEALRSLGRLESMRDISTDEFLGRSSKIPLALPHRYADKLVPLQDLGILNLWSTRHELAERIRAAACVVETQGPRRAQAWIRDLARTLLVLRRLWTEYDDRDVLDLDDPKTW